MVGINLSGRVYIPVTEDTRTIVWMIVRVSNGTDQAFAQGRGGFSDLAYYMNNSFTDVNEYTVDNPILSPDRQWIVYERRDASSPVTDLNNLMLLAADDQSAPVSIAVSPSTGPGTGSKVLNPLGFSPDSTQVYYQVTDNDTDDDLDIRRVDIDGTNDTLILATTFPDISAGGMPRISHDGTKLAYAIDADAGSGSRGIYVCNSDGTGNTKIYTGTASFGTSFPLDFYAWSPDDEWLVFVDQSGSPITRKTSIIHPDGTGQIDVFTDTVSGGNIFQMVPGFCQHTPFTPNSSQLLVTYSNFLNTPAPTIGLLDTDGSETFTEITHVGALSGGLTLDYDGVRAYWCEDNNRVVSSLLDSTDYRIEDDMTDGSTTPPHDDFEFDGFYEN